MFPLSVRVSDWLEVAVIELACGEHGADKADRMVEGVDNGAVTKWMSADLHVDNSPQGRPDWRGHPALTKVTAAPNTFDPHPNPKVQS